MSSSRVRWQTSTLRAKKQAETEATTMSSVVVSRSSGGVKSFAWTTTLEYTYTEYSRCTASTQFHKKYL